MNRIPAYTTAVFLIFLSLHQTTYSQVRNFSNKSGKVIKASIVSATADEVTLKMENGRTITGGVNFFSPEDQKYIKAWAKKNPIQIKYEFDIKASRSRTDRDKVSEGSTNVVYETWIYKITLENRSRAGQKGSPVSGLTLHYNIALMPKANAEKSRYLLKGAASSGRYAIKKGKVSLGTMPYLKRGEYSTDTFPINNSELAPGWYYADGTKDEKEDDLEGIIIKIMKGKDVVFEKSIGSKVLENLKWSAP